MVMLVTTRLILLPPTLDDPASWARLDADVDATRYIGGVQDGAWSRSGLTDAIEIWARRAVGLFSVFESATGRWVGRVGPWLPAADSEPEIGWALDPGFGKLGYATEAARIAIRWVFDELRWPDVVHRIHPDNIASIAVAGRLGSRWLRSGRGAFDGCVEIYGQKCKVECSLRR